MGYRFDLGPCGARRSRSSKRKRDAGAPQAIMLLYENSSTQITYLTLTLLRTYLHQSIILDCDE